MALVLELLDVALVAEEEEEDKGAKLLASFRILALLVQPYMRVKPLSDEQYPKVRTICEAVYYI